MTLTRRDFMRSLGVGLSAAALRAWIGARGHEAWLMAGETDPGRGLLLLSSNENPLGPGAAVLDAVRRALGRDGAMVGRYPDDHVQPLVTAIARRFWVRESNVLLGIGSTQVLFTVTHAYTGPDRPLVGGLPTYEGCQRYARVIETPVKGIPVDRTYRLDLDAMLRATPGAGLVYICNPNNPTGTVVPSSQVRDFIQRLLHVSPTTRVLVDEAYFDYVTDPAYETLIPLALQEPRVIVTRTFSKAYGMAGLRVGFGIAHESTIRELKKWYMMGGISGLSLIAARAALEQPYAVIEQERDRNARVRAFTRRFFHQLGYRDSDSETNFIFVDLRMPVETFQRACLRRGVRVGRAFPPFWTHARISLGTQEEMEFAVGVFEEVLKRTRPAPA